MLPLFVKILEKPKPPKSFRKKTSNIQNIIIFFEMLEFPQAKYPTAAIWSCSIWKSLQHSIQHLFDGKNMQIENGKCRIKIISSITFIESSLQYHCSWWKQSWQLRDISLWQNHKNKKPPVKIIYKKISYKVKKSKNNIFTM